MTSKGEKDRERLRQRIAVLMTTPAIPLHQLLIERQLREYRPPLVILGDTRGDHSGPDGYKLTHNPFHFDNTTFELLDDDRDLPEWQRRAKRSKDAKAALVAKLKGKRK